MLHSDEAHYESHAQHNDGGPRLRPSPPSTFREPAPWAIISSTELFGLEVNQQNQSSTVEEVE